MTAWAADPTDVMRARLYEQGIVIVNGELDDDLAARVAAELMLLDATRDAAVKLWLNSGGGTLEAAFALIDVIDLLGVPVHATCIGRAEGPALGVLTVASHRVAIPHARLRLCEPATAFAGRADDVARWSAERDAATARFCARLADATKRPAEWIAEAIREGRFLDAHEAMRAGFIDEIAHSNAATVSSIDRRPIGFRSRQQRPL
ncbi:MAG TPA: ATP-dependent Clp protease proteolytic subunit [Acidimicrobiia bacterium]|nr:ATP-dependent Clp protease proteolytic subunit [Acidimicrobiia bacterium]